MFLTTDEIRRKLREIDEVIVKIKEQQSQADNIVNKKLDKVIGEKLVALQIEDDIATFKQENALFVAVLKTMMEGQLEAYFQDSLVALKIARRLLLAIL